eukprot:CAMPEP_0176137196 /NCGR_PEP_ID=MMETSP0120_2-20121206/69643_1 /TAXON_ID=160619 /ORGANISM="Kryptoperidinium foliaceum, Strain CCMP 1326" /LENGTH=84 /DNA_ID=CAMNT_0017473019 /DNA_START=42 /DNA_END=292 /DNA_ORIENTATION=-
MLSQEDLRPLLQMLSLQVRQAKFGFVARRPLEDVSLEGNPLEPEFPLAIARALGRLRMASAAAWPPEAPMEEAEPTLHSSFDAR